jgi:hypothetical protein
MEAALLSTTPRLVCGWSADDSVHESSEKKFRDGTAEGEVLLSLGRFGPVMGSVEKAKVTLHTQGPSSCEESPR